MEFHTAIAGFLLRRNNLIVCHPSFFLTISAPKGTAQGLYRFVFS
jgi:hypothetical protein